MPISEISIAHMLQTPGPGVPGDLYPRLPQIRRARGYRLYTKGGRFLDFWQGGGGAILGHMPSGLGRSLKAEIDRGFLASGPSVEQERLVGSLKNLFPGWRFVCFSNLRRAVEGIHRSAATAPTTVLDPGLRNDPPAPLGRDRDAGGDSDDESALRPTGREFRTSATGAGRVPEEPRPSFDTSFAPAAPVIRLWRPFLEPPESNSSFDARSPNGPAGFSPPSIGAGYLLPILPGMHATAAILLGAPPELPELIGDALRRHDLALISHGVTSLIRHLAAEPSPGSQTPVKGARGTRIPSHEIDLWNPGTGHLDLDSSAVWTRRGAYLTPRCSKEEYSAVFDIYLKNKFYLAPRYPGPSILPHGCSPGELAGFLAVTTKISKGLAG